MQLYFTGTLLTYRGIPYVNNYTLFDVPTKEIVQLEIERKEKSRFTHQKKHTFSSMGKRRRLVCHMHEINTSLILIGI